MTDAVVYDEFGLFASNAEELGIPYVVPKVERLTVGVGNGDGNCDGQAVSALRWGSDDPHLVLLHGGAQNAHTWDSVALLLDCPLLALDLPGHGHSSHRPDHAYWPQENAVAVERAIRALGVAPRLVVGMSLGGLTSVALAAQAPDLVPNLLLVDVTPGVDGEKASAIVQFVNGPESFASFDEILDRTILFNPTRSHESLRRGVLHNACQLADGSWVWRYDLPRTGTGTGDSGRVLPGLDELWDAIGAYNGRLTLARGSESPVVSDDDVAELQRRNSAAEVIVVDGAGHSIQGDKPRELAAIIAAKLAAA